MEIKIKKLKKDAVIPTKGSPFAAGSDLYSVEDDVKVGAGETVMIGNQGRPSQPFGQRKDRQKG